MSAVDPETDQRRGASPALAQSEDSPHPDLAERLLAIQEDERKRIARVLHDDLGQQVASLSILTGALKRRLPADDAENRQQADRIKEKLVALAERMSRLSLDLYPSVLEHAGIGVALRQLCEDYAASSGINLAYECSGDLKDVPLQVGLCLYRVLQDVLESAGRGDPGTRVSVRLLRFGSQMELSITDWERRLFAAGESDERLTLWILQERARSVRGEIRFETSPDASEPRLTVCVAC